WLVTPCTPQARRVSLRSTRTGTSPGVRSPLARSEDVWLGAGVDESWDGARTSFVWLVTPCTPQARRVSLRSTRTGTSPGVLTSRAHAALVSLGASVDESWDGARTSFVWLVTPCTPQVRRVSLRSTRTGTSPGVRSPLA